MVSDVIDELLSLAEAYGCKFVPNFKQLTMDDMLKPNQAESIMWQDFVARRPMEVETYLGSPIKLARDAGVPVPRIETLYAILHNLNIVNRNRPKDAAPGSPNNASPLPPRGPSQAGFRPMMPNGNGMPPRQPRPRASSNFSNAGGMRRPMANGGPNGYGRPPPQMNGGGSRAASRRGSMDGNDLEEFSHLVLYDDIPEGQEPSFGTDNSDMALRERELQLRQRELALREQEMRMRRGPPQPSAPPSRRGPPPSVKGGFDEDDEDDDYFDPAMATIVPMIDPDNFDMMSVTSKKNRKMPGPSQSQMRRNPEGDGPPSKSSRFRPFGRHRQSSQMSQISQMPTVNDNILDDPLLSFTSNRYGAVDRGAMAVSSRANSLTASRMDEMQFGGPVSGHTMTMTGGYPRRTSHSPGNQYSPSMRGGNGRPSPPNGFGPANGQTSPPGGARQPAPRFPGPGNGIAPQQLEQQIGVSSFNHPKPRNDRSLTGSASASANSGDFSSEKSTSSGQGSLQH